ncbi:MAG TPA: hypothetical protein VJH37_00955 [Candidatus Nanoarchaeia archaeon]|nr:hypothetical protein [Candidatus Nanoarchaeia archaeon]
MGKAQRGQRSYLVPILVIVTIGVSVLYLSGSNNSPSGQVSLLAPILPPQSLLPPQSQVELSLKGSLDSYWLDFTNIQGTRYSFRYLSSFNNVYRYGEANSDLVFVENSPSPLLTGNIGVNDMIVLSNQRNPQDIQATTHVVQYTNYDSINRVITLVDLDPTRNTKQFTYQVTDPNGGCTFRYPCLANLIYSGNTYRANILDMQGTMDVDLNADTVIRGGTKVNIIAQERSSSGQFTPVVIDLGSSAYSGNSMTIPIGTQISLTLYQGDPSRQQVIVDTSLITAVRIPATIIPLTVLQIAKISAPH